MRWPTSGEVFCLAALLAAQVLGGAVFVGLWAWLGLPKWVVLAGPFAGMAGLFAGVRVLVRLDDRRREHAAPGAAADINGRPGSSE